MDYLYTGLLIGILDILYLIVIIQIRQIQDNIYQSIDHSIWFYQQYLYNGFCIWFNNVIL